MNIKTYPFCAFLFFFFVSSAWAAEIRVSPGSGTLAAAAAAASDGDTLVLEDGGFSGAVTVSKSLIIRPVSRATIAQVTNEMTIQGSGITVTVQGLEFAADVDINQAAAVRLLENEWLSGNIDGYGYKSSEGDGTLVVVGNRFASGSNINDVFSDGAYIAGNILLGGWIETYSYVWIVGNEIYRTGGNETIKTSGDKTAYILANRVRCTHSRSISACINADASAHYIAGNIVEVNDSALSGFNDYQRGMYVKGTAHATVINNVVRALDTVSERSGSAITVTTPSSRVSGNIVIDYGSVSGMPINVTSSITDVTHNLCFNSSGDCPVGEGNLNVDPMFVDLVDYQLTPGSPAINAGPPDLGMADLDRTQNDMGVYGGPWSIAQYDAQREPDNFAPYVYPLFNVDSILSGGILEIQALGVARLR